MKQPKTKNASHDPRQPLFQSTKPAKTIEGNKRVSLVASALLLLLLPALHYSKYAGTEPLKINKNKNNLTCC
jgi:hypothetical protein